MGLKRVAIFVVACQSDVMDHHANKCSVRLRIRYGSGQDSDGPAISCSRERFHKSNC